MKNVFFTVVLFLLFGCSVFAQDGEYIDLGLPSGTKWKTVNESGYFEYDAAVAIFGKELPSKEQWVELKEKCNWEWVDGDGDIQSGYYVVGPNGKRIFLPAWGYRYRTVVDDDGTSGLYWSSSYYNEYVAWYMSFESGYVGVDDYFHRGSGLSVRLVRD